jgi:hypothetical protein
VGRKKQLQSDNDSVGSSHSTVLYVSILTAQRGYLHLVLDGNGSSIIISVMCTPASKLAESDSVKLTIPASRSADVTKQERGGGYPAVKYAGPHTDVLPGPAQLHSLRKTKCVACAVQ